MDHRPNPVAEPWVVIEDWISESVVSPNGGRRELGFDLGNRRAEGRDRLASNSATNWS